MWLPFIPFIRHSKFNGWILVTRSGEVWVGGVKQTSSRYALLWEDAINRGKDLLDRPVTNVLMLGLAGGGALPAIYEGFPFCNITAVEIDPVMVDIAKRLGNYKPNPFPKVLVGDAEEVLAGFTETFDVILVDIFNGPTPSMLIDSDSFWDQVKQRLAPGGVVVLNVAGSSTRIYAAQKHFKRNTSWHYYANVFCALAD